MDQQLSIHHSPFFIIASLIPLLLPFLISLLYISRKPFLNSPASPTQASQLPRTQIITSHVPALNCNGVNDAVGSVSGRYGEGVECAVCLSEVEDGEEVAELGCAHVFHKVCLERWVSSGMRATCPICRRLIGFHRLVSENNSGEEGVVLLRLVMLGVSRRTRDRGDNFWLR
uniref:RING-type domain-containing protein n=1 Tax=Kalanchoe fedtschenkoi TaxID=63787 RepID=A0A7N0U2K6_KALFE